VTKRSFRFHAFVWGMAAVITLWHVVMMAAAKADHELGARSPCLRFRVR
jgi:hypothetical protein